MNEIIEALEGCVKVLENMDEALHDPRYWTLIRALRSCADEIEELLEQP